MTDACRSTGPGFTLHATDAGNPGRQGHEPHSRTRVSMCGASFVH